MPLTVLLGKMACFAGIVRCDIGGVLARTTDHLLQVVVRYDRAKLRSIQGLPLDVDEAGRLNVLFRTENPSFPSRSRTTADAGANTPKRDLKLISSNALKLGGNWNRFTTADLSECCSSSILM